MDSRQIDHPIAQRRLARTETGLEGPDLEPAWTWGLRTTGYGYQGDVRPLPALAETASDGNRLEYRRAGLSEWYANDERGLEQGFTLERPPAGAGEVLVLEMALDTGLAPVLVGNPEQGAEQAVEFTRALQDTRRPHLFVWGQGGHGQRAYFPTPEGGGDNVRGGLDIRLDQSLPAFVRCSLDGDFGDGDPGSGDPEGQVNQYLRWRTGDIADREDGIRIADALVAHL